MRVLWLLLAALLLVLVGAQPGLAVILGSLLMFTIGLALHGAALLLAQTVIKAIVLAAGALWLLGNRRATA
ncbi:hypothetical protein [Streptomyces sp. NPDC005799]|uniref:hypothetical protein n=1 Tax=Streptomyces sp. NPDC005799 TaxID=3154678 RepID=UPI0033CEBCAB